MTSEPLTQENCSLGEIKERVEGMKEDMNDFYHSIGKPKVWAQSNDELCDLCEEHAKKLVGKWFPFAKGGSVRE